MTKKALSIFAALIFLIPLFSLNEANALSCEKTYPRIATVESIEINQDNSIKLNLKWAYSFSENRVNTLSLIEIDSYSEIVNEYIADQLDLLSSLEEQDISWNFKEIYLVADFADKLNISASDIIITAPPIHVCSDSFLAVYDESGTLKQALLRGDFDDYSFAGESIITEIGDDISCEGYSCQVKTDFLINDDKFSLVPGQAIEIDNSVFSRIFLKGSKAPEKGVDAESIFPWGRGRLVEYLIDFNPIKGSNDKTEAKEEDEELAGKEGSDERDSEETLEENSGQEEIEDQPEEVEKRNIFSRFFSWLKNLFTRE